MSLYVRTRSKLWSKLMLAARPLSLSTKKMAEFDEVLCEVHGSTGLITMNRPSTLNALNLSMIRTMHPVIKEWENDPNIGLIVIKGAGEKSFCAGGDVKSIALERETGGDLREVFFKEEYRLNLEIGCLKTPFVAMISGVTMGGGVGLSVHGLHRVATEKTLFAMPETAIGLFPDVGGGYFLPRLQGKLGLFLALTGHRLKARDVYHAGIATHFVDHKELPYMEEELLKLDKPSKELVANVLTHYHETCQNTEEFSLSPHIETINETFSQPSLECIFRALEENGSEWCLDLLNTLKKMSPVSMKVAFRQLEEGAKMNLADDLIMEYRISQRCMATDDFFEGTRAVLIDRDNSPKWQHATIEDVTDDIVDDYFKPLPDGNDLTF